MSDDLANTASRFRRLLELRDRRDASRVASEAAKVEHDEYEQELYAELADSEFTGSVRLNFPEWGEVVFTPRSTAYGRILDRAEAIRSFEDLSIDDVMVGAKVQQARLNEEIRHRLEQGDEMPKGVDFYENTGITVSRRGVTTEEL